MVRLWVATPPARARQRLPSQAKADRSRKESPVARVEPARRGLSDGIAADLACRARCARELGEAKDVRPGRSEGMNESPRSTCHQANRGKPMILHRRRDSRRLRHQRSAQEVLAV